MRRPQAKGFTLIEVITAVVLIAIIMIPIALIAMEYVRSIAYADSLTMAANLARREMSVVNNLSYTDSTLTNGYDNTAQNYEGYKFDLRCTVNYVAGTNSNLKRVRARAFPSGSTEQLIELATYVMNVQFGAGSAGGALGDEKDSFVASAGTLERNQLSNVTLQNIRTTGTGMGNITMTRVIMTSSTNKTLRTITMDNDTRFSGSIPLTANVPTQIDLQKNFFMNLSTTYSGATNGGRFNFATGTDVSYTLTIVFVFFDNTQSVPRSWMYGG